MNKFLFLLIGLAFAGFTNEEYLLKKEAIRAEKLPEKYESLNLSIIS